GNLYRGYLDYDGALAELEVARQTLPNDLRVFELKGYIERRQGRWEESTRNLERAIELDPRNFFMLQQIAISYGYLRRYAEEKAMLDRALAIEPNDIDTKTASASVEFHWQAEPDYGPPLCVLGLIDAGLGRKEEALREGRRAVELLPVEKDAINGPLMIEYLAVIAAWVGDKDLACEQLATVVRPPSTVSYG